VPLADAAGGVAHQPTARLRVDPGLTQPRGGE
jgi:hypothetical protein